MAVDKDSPPGAWKEEMERAPWAFGQPKRINYTDAISIMRLRGLGHEADVIAAEIYRLNDEIGRLKKKAAK
jgi:hypothetical protein